MKICHGEITLKIFLKIIRPGQQQTKTFLKIIQGQQQTKVFLKIIPLGQILAKIHKIILTGQKSLKVLPTGKEIAKIL